jgi:hypothetical protein
MVRKPNPLLIEFLDKNIPLPPIDWETVPPGVNPMDAWEMYDETWKDGSRYGFPPATRKPADLTVSSRERCCSMTAWKEF